MKKARYKAVIFDMDGTITIPVIDFQLIRNAIGLPPGDIAHEISKLPPAEQNRAWEIIKDFELEFEKQQQLQPGAQDLLDLCRKENIRLGLITRNVRRSVDVLCRKFNLTFDSIITREFPHMKPHPAPILHMLKEWNTAPADTLMVGDYIHDIDCGKAAGTATCFFRNNGKTDYTDQADFTVASMPELEKQLFRATDS
jgi:HAD superfamily hydrolase (TIGR01549 family)